MEFIKENGEMKIKLELDEFSFCLALSMIVGLLFGLWLL